MAQIPVIAPPPPRRTFRFALPPSLGPGADPERTRKLEHFLSLALGKVTEVTVAPSYEVLAKDLLSGKSDAAWAPPFVCARIEAMGVRVLVRGVRHGTSSYRAALICRADKKLTLETLPGKTAVWTERDSVGGYLLAMAMLRSRGLDPAKMFFAQTFAGSYRAAVDEVIAGKADVCSIFAPVLKGANAGSTGIDKIALEYSEQISVIAFSDEAPNDGVAVGVSIAPALVSALEKSLLALNSTDEGTKLLADTFQAERFEPAPRMGYRALYRVALASL